MHQNMQWLLYGDGNWDGITGTELRTLDINILNNNNNISYLLNRGRTHGTAVPQQFNDMIAALE